MHICFLSEHFHKRPSGPRKACMKLGEALIQLGHRVSLIGIAPKNEDEPWTGSRPARLRRYSWKLVPVKIGRKRFYARELAALHKEEKIDVVLAMGLEAGAAALRFRKKSGVPFVLNPRSYLAEPVGHPKFRLAKKLTEECNALVAISRGALTAWYGRFGATVSVNSWAAPNGVEMPDADDPAEPLHDLHLQFGIPLILSVGMLRRPKGHHLVLQALAELRNRPWQLVIAGEGPAREELEGAVVKLGLVGRVHLPGMVEGARLRWLYRNAQFFCLFPVYFEACGNAFLEALSYGLPIIASNAGAICEAVGDCGVCVRLRGADYVDEPHAINGLVQALADYTDPRVTLDHIRSVARKRAQARHWIGCAQIYLGAIAMRSGEGVPLNIKSSATAPHWSVLAHIPA